MAKGFPNTGVTVVDSAADLPTPSAELNGLAMYQKDTDQIKFCNGAAWVNHPTVAASTSTSTTTYNPFDVTGYVARGAMPSVTVVTGTSALVYCSASWSGNNSSSTYLSFDVSGASSISASDNYSVRTNTGSSFTLSGAWVIGLSAGSNTFKLTSKTDKVSFSLTYYPGSTIVVIPL